jgi:hypothetical protein
MEIWKIYGNCEGFDQKLRNFLDRKGKKPHEKIPGVLEFHFKNCQDSLDTPQIPNKVPS